MTPLVHAAAPRPVRKWEIAAATAVALAVRLILAREGAWHSSDSYHYFCLAESIHSHAVYASGGSQHPDLSRPPLYPVLVAAARFVSPDITTAGFVVTLLASLGSMLAVARLAGALLGHEAARAGLAIGALSPLAATALPSLPDPLFTCLIMASASAIARTGTTPSAAPAVEAGIWAGLATLARAEGFAYPLAAGTLVLFFGRHVGAARRRLRDAGIVLALGLLAYLPWVAYVSRELGRPVLAPGFEYVDGQRYLADVVGAREWNIPGLDWRDRVLFSPTADLRGTLWARWFETGDVPALDPRVGSPRRSPSSFDPSFPSRIHVDRILRRAQIVRRNLVKVAATLWTERLVTVSTLGLGVLGLTKLVRERRWRVMLFLGALGGWTGLPLASHVEYRFLFPWTALAAVVASAGMVSLARRPAAAAILALAVGADTLLAERPRRDVPRQYEALAEMVRAAELPSGPLLATRPNAPYLAARPYRPLPVGGPEVVAETMIATGAAAVVVETTLDGSRRPDLGALLEDPPPAAWRVAARLRTGHDEVRLLVLRETPEPR